MSKTASDGITLCELLFVVFLILKLTGVITWSWWWVTCPLWGPWAFVFALVIIFVMLKGK